jgi:hypothetical protein
MTTIEATSREAPRRLAALIALAVPFAAIIALAWMLWPHHG